MFRREAVADGQRPNARGAARLGHEAPVAEDRSRAIAAAVEKHENTRRVASRRDRPLRAEAVQLDGVQLDVVGNGPDRPDLVRCAAAALPIRRAEVLRSASCEQHRFRCDRAPISSCVNAQQKMSARP